MFKLKLLKKALAILFWTCSKFAKHVPLNANCVHTSDSRIYCCIHQLSSNQIFRCFKVAIHISSFFKCIKVWSTWINSCRLTKILSMFRILCQILHLSSVYLYIYAHGIFLLWIEKKKCLMDRLLFALLSKWKLI